MRHSPKFLLASTQNFSLRYEIALIFGAGGPLNAVTADRCLGTAHRIDPKFTNSNAMRRELRAKGSFPPEKPYVDLGDESVNSKMSAEERSAREHQSRYKRRLFERYYTMEASVKRHLQVHRGWGSWSMGLGSGSGG